MNPDNPDSVLRSMVKTGSIFWWNTLPCKWYLLSNTEYSENAAWSRQVRAGEKERNGSKGCLLLRLYPNTSNKESWRSGINRVAYSPTELTLDIFATYVKEQSYELQCADIIEGLRPKTMLLKSEDNQYIPCTNISFLMNSEHPSAFQTHNAASFAFTSFVVFLATEETKIWLRFSLVVGMWQPWFTQIHALPSK